jgi:hypothetical protein
MKAKSALRCLPFVACTAALVAAATSASAQTVPNLVGTWKGKPEAVFVGPNPHRPSDGTVPGFGGEMELTYVFKQQQGTRFAGEFLGKFTETVIGTLRPPAFQSGIMVDNDGEYDFTLRNPTTMDVCYRHNNTSSKVVACWTMQKQP